MRDLIPLVSAIASMGLVMWVLHYFVQVVFPE
jgi:hypothetical protein